MRPLRLDLSGFTVFREPTTVDLTDADFFVLVGPTGSGKSTVLDAICFALYGTVPRWGDRRRIEHALAPSTAEAKVRLVFEASGSRFVATRVVRRDGKGRVSTSHAGLEQLPLGFDLSTFDAAPTERGEAGLGTVLAGTPAEMDAAVAEAVGLPYEQFTSCVVLPQGEFARFLHAKPAERQEILVNLLGLHVYQRIGERAGVLQREAESRAAAARGVLTDLAGADEASLELAERAVTTARRLIDNLESELPALIEAAVAGETARATLAGIERDIALLAAVKTPTAAATIGDEVAAAREAADACDAAVLAAEEREEKLRAELIDVGDRTALQRVLDLHGDRSRLAARVKELAAGVAAATAEHDKVSAALASAQGKAEKAAHAVGVTRHAVEQAQTADRAAALRMHLTAGDPCPVCEQTVSSVPAVSKASALTAARAKLATAEKAAEAAVRTVNGHDTTLRELDRSLAAAKAQHDESARRLAALADQLAGAPKLAAVESALLDVTNAERAVAVAAHTVRTSRQAARVASSGLKKAQDRLRAAWRDFDAVRDTLVTLGPPATDRDDLVGAWLAMQAWAGATYRARGRAREESLAAAEAALSAISTRVGRIDSLFAESGVDDVRSTADPAAYRQAAAVALERATAGHRRILERRDQAIRLAAQVAEHDRAAQVAKSLAQHLRANQFERWVLTEALDALVLGASHILRELSAGQYDLTHDKGEFSVVDHADAGLHRGVRTLSGGETFQASLSLALALSEQLSGLSTASASLESIMLDEGFGTLDAATLDTVAATLENLAARGDRMVGIVTHVPALAERIPVRFEVSKDARGSARIVRSG